MKLGILHLSDIHLGDQNNAVSARIEQIAGAFRGIDHDIDALCIAVTGDIAFSGSSKQYEVAAAFFSDLQDSLRPLCSTREIHTILIPGNHDCNFEKHTDARELAIETMASRMDKIDLNGEISKQCLAVQDDFFEFESTFRRDRPLGMQERLLYAREFRLNGTSIRFNCYNTAWLSQIKEQPGRLLFPVQLAETPTILSCDCSLVLSLFHHPVNWLEPNNSILFKKIVARSSDIILTGHEHVADAYLKQHITGENVLYTEGAVLQDDDDPSISGFNVILVDLEEKEKGHKILEYQWSEDKYLVQTQSDWLPFVRNQILAAQQFENNPTFEARLLDAGTGFTHPYKQDLQLHDIFVYPDLRSTLCVNVTETPTSQ
jgi:DNA repair exonuclease SbcCD nuclease subunit